MARPITHSDAINLRREFDNADPLEKRRVLGWIARAMDDEARSLDERMDLACVYLDAKRRVNNDTP